MYIVIHSLDPYLLARMATDLQLEGMWYVNSSPFYKSYKWMAIYGGFNYFCFHDHNCVEPATRFTLTEENYLEVLEFIINNKDK